MNKPRASASPERLASKNPCHRIAVRNLLIVCGSAALVQSGCARVALTEGISIAAKRYGVSDASAATVKGRGHLRFDAHLRADLDELLSSGGAPSGEKAAETLRAANDLAIRQASGELERMPPEGLHWLAARYGHDAGDPASGGFRESLKKRFSDEAAEKLQADLARLDDAREARRLLAETRRRLRATPGDRGRTTRALLAAPFFVPAVIGAEIADAEAIQRIMVADFDRTVVYQPQTASLDETADDLASLGLPELAGRYAPVFIQQVRLETTYDPSDDQIGRIYLTGAVGDIQVNVDTTQPTIYWTHGQARIGERRYDQLTYVAWYPGRPAMSGGDVQAGRIDGVVIRITLDRHRRPAVYEFVRACGCYHTLWVAEFVEAAARIEFGPPSADRQFAIQSDTRGRSLFLPALVRDDGTRPCRPAVYVDAGYHMVPVIRPSVLEPPQSASDTRTYSLEPYDTLTRLPLGDGVASMFGGDGLVHNAGRLEGILLAPTGMLSAGQPRQLGTMKIRMDAYDHDDPRLLERHLRFPGDF